MGRYSTYLLPKQDGGTIQIKVNSTQHTSAQKALSQTKISQDFNSMAFLIDNLPIIWWEI